MLSHVLNTIFGDAEHTCIVSKYERWEYQILARISFLVHVYRHAGLGMSFCTSKLCSNWYLSWSLQGRVSVDITRLHLSAVWIYSGSSNIHFFVTYIDPWTEVKRIKSGPSGRTIPQTISFSTKYAHLLRRCPFSLLTVYLSTDQHKSNRNPWTFQLNVNTTGQSYWSSPGLAPVLTSTINKPCNSSNPPCSLLLLPSLAPVPSPARTRPTAVARFAPTAPAPQAGAASSGTVDATLGKGAASKLPLLERSYPK